MEYRSGQITDFANVETFVWQAIFPAFNHPDLNETQQAENDALVAEAQSLCLSAIEDPQKAIFIAQDSRLRRMVGFIIVDKSADDYPEIVWLIVSRKHWGEGVADRLMQMALEWIGSDKPIKLAIHYYLERAMAFFGKFGFENTGEPAGDYLIPRILFLREAGPLEEAIFTDEASDIAVIPDLSQVADSPLIEDTATSLAKDLFSDIVDQGQDVTDVADQEEEELVLDEFLIDSEVPEDAIEKIPLPDAPKVAPDYRSRYSDIEFEVDYGDEDPSLDDLLNDAASSSDKLDFEFAFEEEAAPEVENETADHFELEDLETKTVTEEEEPIIETKHSMADEVADESPESPKRSDIRLRFQDYFMAFVTDLFGNKQAVKYLEQLRLSDFQAIVENSIQQLIKRSDWEDRFEKLAGDLTEYFVVELAGDLHQRTFPQRLLRYQSKEVGEESYFSMINDYLDFSSEDERVDTDFITMSPKRLKNASKSFLRAGADERIYYLVDQSILGNLKNGFAFTDQALYWKALLQPNHAAYYEELKSVKIEKGSVNINGHFFDTGKSGFNLKIALLLKKLGRLKA